MARVLLVLMMLSVAAPCAAQSGATAARCRSIPGPSLGTMPDEPPRLHAPASETARQQAAIEGMPLGEASRPAAMFELAEAYRALGRGADEIRTLARIIQDHPQWEGDRVQFRLGQALAASGQMDRARQVWMHVVRDFPASDYVPAIYVAFGDYFFGAGEHDSARQFFDRVLDFAGSRWRAYAQYRLAWTHARQGDRSALVRLGEAATTLGDQSHPQLGAVAIRVAVQSERGAIEATLACAP